MDSYRPPPPLDENFAKMKKSCERIAQVLGIKDTMNLPERSISNEPKFVNMDNPSYVRARNSVPKEEDG